MKRLLRALLPALALLASLPSQSTMAGEIQWPFFAFDNGVGRGVWPASKQAETVRELGYDGIHYNYTNPADFKKKLDACKAAGVPIHAVYVYSFVNKPENPYDPGVKEVIRMLKGSNTVIWLTLRDGRKGMEDEQAAGIVRDIAGQAAESGLKVSLYPHAGFYVATAEEAVRVVKAANMPNVGVTINLCHELFAGNSERLDQVVTTAAPYLNLVSINGASPVPGKGPKVWDTLALGSGSFDVTGFLRLIRDSGYRGPIGHQFFAVAGDDVRKLTLAIQSWKKIKPSLLNPESLRAAQ
jgi:sugar phosphate isomerase/epimerase